MNTKGNERSNAKIGNDDIMKILSKRGEIKVFTQNYKPFPAGKSQITEHKERLFLCCIYKDKPKRSLIQSPSNYTEGKFKLLDQLLLYFPKNIDKFVDMFCGGCNV